MIETGFDGPVGDVPDPDLSRPVDPESWSDTRWALYALEGIPRAQRAAGCAELEAVVEWADLHPGEAVPPVRVPGQERGVRIGGDGTPLVAEFAVAEMAAVLGRGVFAGRRLLADALDVRHRLPSVWRRIQRCEVEAWQARKIAQATHPLTLVQAHGVDAQVADQVGRLPWSRMLAVVDAAVIAADPDRAARLADEARTQAKVHVGQTDEHGLATVYGRVETPDAVWLEAQVTRLAELLRTVRGDTRPVDQRRASALGLLARPAEAIKLILAGEDACRAAEAEPHDDAELHDDPEPAAPCEPDDDLEPPEPTAPCEPDDDLELPEPEGPDAPDSVTAAIIAAIRGLDPAKLGPPATLYAHVSWETLTSGGGVCRVENVGPIVGALAQRWLCDSGATIAPVIDLPAGLMPVDGYEHTPAMREHLRLRQPFSAFPYSPTSSRCCDVDHPEPYQWPGPDSELVPGQTGLQNAGPLGRFEHRLVTHGGWLRRQPEPGTYLVRAPHGHTWLINNTGTHHLGDGDFADAVWRASMP